MALATNFRGRLSYVEATELDMNEFMYLRHIMQKENESEEAQKAKAAAEAEAEIIEGMT